MDPSGLISLTAVLLAESARRATAARRTRHFQNADDYGARILDDLGIPAYGRAPSLPPGTAPVRTGHHHGTLTVADAVVYFGTVTGDVVVSDGGRLSFGGTVHGDIRTEGTGTVELLRDTRVTGDVHGAVTLNGTKVGGSVHHAPVRPGPQG